MTTLETPNREAESLAARHSPPATSASPLPVTIIEARRDWQALELDELWRYRHLLWMFMWRDIKAQQKQTVLGFCGLLFHPWFRLRR